MFFAFFILCVYLLTLSNTIYGGDSGDLVSAILTGGFAHPPGYPLYTLLGHLTLNLPLSALTPAGKVTIISVLATALTFFVLEKILKIIYGVKYNRLYGLFSLSVLGFNYLIWLYSIVPEVFPLNSLLVTLLLYCALRYYKQPNAKFLYAIALLSGLSIAHHHTFILILPSVFYLVWKKRKKVKLVPTLAFFIAGLLPLLYLFFSAVRLPEVMWGNPTTIPGFIRLITRQDYGTFVPGPFTDPGVFQRILQLPHFISFALNDFTLPGILIALLGLSAIIMKKYVEPHVRTAYLLAFILYIPVFLFYANFPFSDLFAVATIERFFIIPYLLFFLPLYHGIYIFSLIMKKVGTSVIKSGKLKILFPTLATLILFIIPLSMAIKNYRTIQFLRNDRTAESLGYDVLNTITKPSLLFLSSDTTLFDTQYVYYANPQYRKNVIIIHQSKLQFEYYRRSLKKNFPGLTIDVPSKMDFKKFIIENKKNYEIYANVQYNFLDPLGYTWVPEGLLFHLYISKDVMKRSKVADTLDALWIRSKNKNLAEITANNPRKFKNQFLSDIPRIYSVAHQNSAYYFFENKMYDKALTHIKEARILDPQDRDTLYLASLVYFEKNDCKRAISTIIQALQLYPDPLFITHLKKMSDTCSLPSAKKIEIEKLIQSLENQNETKLNSL